MKRLAREITVQRENVDVAFIDILERVDAVFYDQAATLAEEIIGEHDSEYLTLRHNIEAVLKQALVEDCDPTHELIELCDK